MDTATLDRLYLEWSQFTKARMVDAIRNRIYSRHHEHMINRMIELERR